MKHFTKFAAVAALALSAAAFAGAAAAANLVDDPIGTSGDPQSHPQFKWTGTGDGLGTLTVVANASSTLYLDNPAFSSFSGLAGTLLTLSVTAAGPGSDLLDNGSTLTETNLDGTFAFTNGSTLLLGGTITGGWLQGAIGANSANFNNSNGVVTFTSGIPGLLAGAVNESFSFGLTSVSPIIALVGNPETGHLKSFTANSSGGSFDAQTAVPEPATWGLMIVGFGGMGAMLRNRRRAAAVAA